MVRVVGDLTGDWGSGAGGYGRARLPAVIKAGGRRCEGNGVCDARAEVVWAEVRR
jgi:hypothetical protein